jgi:hypothetical protein
MVDLIPIYMGYFALRRAMIRRSLPTPFAMGANDRRDSSMKIELTKNWLIEFERTSSGTVFIGLPHGGAIWIERGRTSYRAKLEVENSGGEILLWLWSWHAIVTPPWWTPRRAEAGLKLAG